MTRKRSYTHWTVDKILKTAKKYSTPGDFYENDTAAYMAARRHEVFEQACAHMKSGRIKWTLAKVKAEAKKYKTRSEFAKKARAAYTAAYRHGYLEDACKHMPLPGSKGKKRGSNERTKEKAEENEHRARL